MSKHWEEGQSIAVHSAGICTGSVLVTPGRGLDPDGCSLGCIVSPAGVRAAFPFSAHRVHARHCTSNLRSRVRLTPQRAHKQEFKKYMFRFPSSKSILS